jgi:phosphatidate cytidylyltransferase
MPSNSAGALLGFGAGIAAILGDLCESAIKRSADVKDSGSLILGRGGALDSIDSLALAAPVYYLLYQVLFLA